MAKWIRSLSLFLQTWIALSGFGFDSSVQAEIQLQPHQKISAQYLMDHPEQKGLLLFHSLGSGKTYITLDYAEKFPTKKVVIVLPEFLKSNWITQMKSFGVKNPARYQMISLDQSEALINHDLNNSLVIVDEVHKLIQKMRLSKDIESEKYIRVYDKLKSAQQLMLLTGTPLFIDTSDISYIANLLEQEEHYPIDPIKFRTEYMRIKPVTSLLRGHLTESKLMTLGIPFIATLGAVVTVSAWPLAVPLVALGGAAIIPIINEVIPARQVAFREFDTEKWKEFAKKYISFYRVRFSENENYPSKVIEEQRVFYNDEQTNFFLSFADEDLSSDQLKIMLAEEKDFISDAVLKVHSSRLQRNLLANPLSGRDIGNLDFNNETGQIVESPKFLKILETLDQQPGQVVIYSNYYVNGIKRFASFLDRHGMKDNYVILKPDQSVEDQIKTLEQYNKASKRILLLHPEITEGISLIGTEQFHILEPINNEALMEQIIGRAIRFQSHAHLPKDRQKVRVYLWESAVNYSVNGLPKSASLIRREHWQRKFSEVNPSMWSKGITEVDENYFLKDETPDQRVKRRSIAIRKDIESLEQMLDQYCIEKNIIH